MPDADDPSTTAEQVAHLARPDQPPRFVVGIGASAGGLEALESLFDHVDGQAETAFVVVTHLSPDFKSLLDELIARHTKMPVEVVSDGATVRPNVVYVIPPNKDMIIAGERFLLSDRDMGGHYTRPIDIFFRSLARDYGPCAAAVVLSGTGSDGARGLRAVKEAGGLTIAQDPHSAKFDGMPRSAIDTGATDHVVESPMIGEIIAAFVRDRVAEADHPMQPQVEGRPEDVIHRIFSALYQSSQVDFSSYKSSMVMRRIIRRAQLCNFERIEDYLVELERDPEEAQSLANDLLISVTEFFRDEDAFDTLVSQAIEPLVEEVGPRRPIRIWVPGCSSGEEAFSIAILVHEAGLRAGFPVTAQIFATDIHRAALDRATRGIFSTHSVQALSPARRERYFEAVSDDEYRVIPAIRKWVVFAFHNLMSDPPFTKLDLVTCRNLLIYLDPSTQTRVLSLLHFGLSQGGFLFLGPSESLGEQEDEFEALNSRWRLFRKQSSRHTPLAPEGLFGLGIVHDRDASAMPRQAGMPRRREQSLFPAYTALLEKFIPAGALITAERELLHTFGETRSYLHPPKGAMSSDILRMVDDSLRVPLATGIERAMRERSTTVFPRVRLSDADMGRQITLSVTPLSTTSDKPVRFLLVTFEEPAEGDQAQTDTMRFVDANELAAQRILDLEHELRHTRENLQATIEEVETSNEELQSTNEELMAANEELQSTNEELQSVNEELYTVNAEYQKQNAELASLNRDIQNLLSATDIGVIFVDDQLQIRRFTAAVTRVVNLIPEDAGRSLSHITTQLRDLDLYALVRQALEARNVVQVDRQADDGGWWQIRCLPYRAEKGEMDGAVITVYSITANKQVEIALAERTQYYETIAELTGAFSLKLDAGANLRGEAEAWHDYTGQDATAYDGRGWLHAVAEDDGDRVRAAWDTAMRQPAPFPCYFRLRHQPTEADRHVAMRAHPLMGDGGALEGWLAVFVDIEDVVQAEDTVRESEEILRTVMGSTPSQIAYVDASGEFRYANDAYGRALQLPTSRIIGHRLRDVLPADLYAEAEPRIAAVLRGERIGFTRHAKGPEDGAEILSSVVYEPDFHSDGHIRGFAVSVVDMSDAHALGRAQADLETTLARLLDVAHIAVVLATADSFAILNANRAACLWSGLTMADLANRSLGDLLPEYSPGRLRALAARRPKDPADRTATARTFLLRADGGTLDVDLTLHAIPGDEHGRVAAVLIDMSDHAATEESLRRRTSELMRVSNSMATFASAASHDLREPIRKIDRFAAMLDEDFGERIGDSGRSTIATIRSAAERMRALIEALLDLYRIAVDADSLRPVAVNTVIADVLDDVAPALEEAGAEVEVGDLPTVTGEHRLLSVLFNNLVGNAVKYRSPDRRLTIQIASAMAEPDSGLCDVTVTDNGRGFDAREEEEIFLPLRRLTGRGEIDGLGMGLAICKRIAEAHGGQISAQSAPGKGSTFRVRLPVAPLAGAP